MSKFRFIGSLRGGCEQRRWRCTRLQRALAQLQNKLVDLIVLKLGDGIFKHEFLGQHAHRKAQVLAGVLCVEVLQSLLALAHVGTERHWLTPMRKDVLEDAASQFVACTAGSSGMPRLETFPTHQAALSSACWRCLSRIRARRATSDREMPSIAACSSAHAYRSGLTRTAITGCSCASFSDIGVAFRSYKRCLSYKCILYSVAVSSRAPIPSRDERHRFLMERLPSGRLGGWAVEAWLDEAVWCGTTWPIKGPRALASRGDRTIYRQKSLNRSGASSV